MNRIPRHTPPLSIMLADLGCSRPQDLARAFGVTRQTAKRWIDADQAPRAVLLAIFWITRWGSAEVACEVHNRATMFAGYVECLKSENVALRAEIGRVLALRDTGAANMPSWRNLPIASVTPITPTAVRA